MCEQEKKRQRIYDLLPAETNPKFLCLPYTKQRKKILQKKELLRKTGSGGLNKNEKFHYSRNGNKEGPHNVNKKAL